MAGLVCVETIYAAVYAGVLDVAARDCLRLRCPRRRSRQHRHPNQRPVLPSIATRPESVDDRSEAGRWEADHIIGRANRSALMCLTERTTRFSMLITMPNGYTATDALAGLVEGVEQIPEHLRRSITFDQGSEWANWSDLVASYHLHAFFCDPHSPWERGQIEDLNRLWRWWFPRGTDLANIAPAHANHVASIINGHADAASTTTHPPYSTLHSPCSDHWNWPTHLLVLHPPVATGCVSTEGGTHSR